MLSNDFSQGMPFGLDNDIDINITNTNTNLNSNTNELSSGMSGFNMGGGSMPIVETPQERVVHRSFVHEVPQE